MLSTLLGQLQGYFSKYFIIGSFSPMLAFTFINGAAAYFVFEPWSAWVDRNLLGTTTVGGGVFLTTSILVGIVLLAYVLSSLSTFLRQVLEGKWWGGFASLIVPAQNKRRLALVGELNQAFQEIPDLAHLPEWDGRLLAARERGRSDHKAKSFSAAGSDAIEALLDKLEEKREQNQVVTAADLTAVAELLEKRLQDFDIDVGEDLEDEHGRFSALVDYAKGSLEEGRGRHTRLQNELNSNFGAQEIAPTKMGNIANTIQSYVMRRYRCNLEVLWTNLMQLVQKDDQARTMLMEAKTQLDFLVACCWLTLLTGIIWSVMAFTITPARLGFLLAALGGPLGAYLWYRAAAEQYRSFADVAMTLFDSFRFDLLQAMHLQAPADVEQERTMWAAIDKLMTFGEEGNFRYVKAVPPAPSPASPSPPASQAVSAPKPPEASAAADAQAPS